MADVLHLVCIPVLQAAGTSFHFYWFLLPILCSNKTERNNLPFVFWKCNRGICGCVT